MINISSSRANLLNKYHNRYLCSARNYNLVYGQVIMCKILSYLDCRNSIAVECQEKSDAVKDQALFL